MNIEDAIAAIFAIFFFWAFLSLFGSLAKSDQNLCGKTYYADYVLFNDLFCEVKE